MVTIYFNEKESDLGKVRTAQRQYPANFQLLVSEGSPLEIAEKTSRSIFQEIAARFSYKVIFDGQERAKLPYLVNKGDNIAFTRVVKVERTYTPERGQPSTEVIYLIEAEQTVRTGPFTARKLSEF